MSLRITKRRVVIAGITGASLAGLTYLYKQYHKQEEDAESSHLEAGQESLEKSCQEWEIALRQATQKGDLEGANYIRQLLRRAYACLDVLNTNLKKDSIRKWGDDLSDAGSFKSALDLEQDLNGFDTCEFHASTPVKPRSAKEPIFDANISIIQEDLWSQALILAQKGKVAIRKLRLEYTGAKNEIDYKARVQCFREALSVLGQSEAKRNAFREPFMRIVTGILIRGDGDPGAFVAAVEKMERFIAKQMSLDGGVSLMKELAVKGVKQLSLYDIVLDFMLFDSFDDLKCPPQSVLNALQTTWVPRSVRVRGLRTAVWACVRSRRSVMPADSFMQHFYDIALTVAPTLACGFLSLGDPEFVDICKGFKSIMIEYINACFAIPGKEGEPLTAESYGNKILEKTRLYSPRAIQMVSKAIANK